MKKMFISILSACLLFAPILSASFVFAGNYEDELLKANVKALAFDEFDGVKTCYNTITSAEGQMVRYCPSCELIDGKPAFLAPKGQCR